MFERMRIGSLLAWGFGVVIALVALLGVLIFQKGNLAAERAAAIGQDAYPKITAANTIRVNVLRNWANTLTLAELPDGEQAKRIAAEMTANSAAITENFQVLEKTLHTERGKQILADTVKARKTYTEHRKEYLELLKSGRRNEALQLLGGTVRNDVEAYAASIQRLIDYQAEKMDESTRAVVEGIQTQQHVTLAVIGLVLAVAVAAALIVSRTVRRILGGEVQYANDVAHEIARGNLGVQVHVEAGDANSLLASMKAMRDGLRAMVANVHDSADQLGQAAGQLAQASAAVAEASAQQSEATSATAAAVEEMTVGIDHIARNAGEAQSFSRQAEALSGEGSEVIRKAAVEMEEIANSVESSSAIIGTLEQQSKEISAIVNVIKEIADQTNLLALNAAIEAARAGEQGRGFAVVADEVRKLAERTSLSTQEIGATIDKIQRGTQDAVRSMLAGVGQVRSGTSLAQQAGQSISEIQNGSQQVAGVVNDISEALREQSAASNEIARNIENIARMVEANNASAEQVAGGSLQLKGLAETLTGAIRSFRL